MTGRFLLPGFITEKILKTGGKREIVPRRKPQASLSSEREIKKEKKEKGVPATPPF